MKVKTTDGIKKSKIIYFHLRILISWYTFQILCVIAKKREFLITFNYTEK